MEFQTRWNRQKTSPEKNSGEILTETAGYIPPKIKIEQLILAGKQLKEFRSHQFDFPDGSEIDESYNDVTRKKNLDLAEASMLLQQSKDSLNEQIKHEKEKKRKLAESKKEEKLTPLNDDVPPETE